ncbi:MAG: amidohydrolase [Actinobacteria bacterium]|nr:MAG: amidohydrolase [Actinomycetota bacterium]
MERYTLISADCHAGGNMEMYREHLDPAYVDEFERWRGAYSNPFRDLQRGGRTRNWDNERRISEQESDGVVAEVVFPNTVPPFFPTGALVARPPRPEELELRLAGIRAHNRWLAAWCAEHGARRAGIAQLFLNDVDEAIADVRFAHAHGLRGGVLLPAVPPDVDWIKPLYAPDFDPLWAVCEQLDVVVNHHSGGGSPDYGPYPVAGVLWIAETTFFSRRALTHLLLGGVFERFPRLRFVVTEQGASWIPPLLAQLDGYHAQMKTGRIGELKYTPEEVLPLAPSEYFARNCWVGASFPSPVEAASRHNIGLDRYMWGSDYPHHESTYPYTREGLRRAFAGTDPSELQQVLAGNAAAVYGFDLEALAPIAARVGPTVDELDTPLDSIPAGATSPAFFRP